MSDTQAKARGKEAVPSAPEMKSAADDFICEFNGFQSDIAKRLKQQEERLTMLDRKTQTHNRP
ncbi:MAG: phage major capsid protein, partial [Lentibacter algarum]